MHPFTNIPNADLTANVLFYACASDYESYSAIYIFVLNGLYYSLEGGYSPEVGSDVPEWVWEPQLISPTEMQNLMLEWDEHQEEIEPV